MDLNSLLSIVYQKLEYWSEKLAHDQPEYEMAIVGGIAYNTVVPERYREPTSDLDLKMVYRGHVLPHSFYRDFTFNFNKLRTQFMLDLAHTIKKRLLSPQGDQKLIALKQYCDQHLYSFKEGEYFTVAIKYKLPYLIYSFQDALDCCRRHPEMTHMVTSLIYHRKGEDQVSSLVDLSMFVNLNNPERLYQLPLNNYLYLGGYSQPLPSEIVSESTKTKVKVASVGHLIRDLMWLALLHHKPEKQERARLKIQRLLDYLIKEVDNSDLVEIVGALADLTQLPYLELGFLRLKQHYLGKGRPTRQREPSKELVSELLVKLKLDPPNLTTEGSLNSTTNGGDLTTSSEEINSIDLLECLVLVDMLSKQLDVFQQKKIIPTFPEGLKV